MGDRDLAVVGGLPADGDLEAARKVLEDVAVEGGVQLLPTHTNMTYMDFICYQAFYLNHSIIKSPK